MLQTGGGVLKANIFMKISTRQRILLFAAAMTAVALFGMAFVYKIGFGAMAAAADAKPERLRDFTFPIWHQYAWTKHGFLSFLSADDFAKGEAYANHPTIYLWWMRALYQVQLTFPKLTLRILGACLSMSASLAAIAYAIPRRVWGRLTLRHAVLMLLGFAYFLTLPTFWISLGKFNVDNGFVLMFPLLVVVSCLVVEDGPHGARFWLSSIVLCLFDPFAAVLFGMFVAIRAVFGRHADIRALRSGAVLAVAGMVIYLQPIIVLNLLHFSSTNSTWFFRSGLDGDMRFYGNFFNSVLFPQFNRPVYYLLVPAGLLIVQLWYHRKFCVATNNAEQAPVQTPDAMMPYLFSVYVFTLLFWPQAVSIHPYLYDAILIGPIGAWVVLNFSMPGLDRRHFLFWMFALLFLITFNLTKIAQAGHCSDCYFPGWGMRGERAG